MKKTEIWNKKKYRACEDKSHREKNRNKESKEKREKSEEKGKQTD